MDNIITTWEFRGKQFKAVPKDTILRDNECYVENILGHHMVLLEDQLWWKLENTNGYSRHKLKHIYSKKIYWCNKTLLYVVQIFKSNSQKLKQVK